MRKIIIAPLLGLIYLYKYVISPLLPGGCRHYPSCSTYAVDALKLHGLFKGSLMASHRIGRCHPWGTHGYDPVPRFFIDKLDLSKYAGASPKSYPASDSLKPSKS